MVFLVHFAKVIKKSGLFLVFKYSAVSERFVKSDFQSFRSDFYHTNLANNKNENNIQNKVPCRLEQTPTYCCSREG